MLKLLLSIALTAISVTHIFSQELKGIVLNASNNQAIPNANILVLNTPNGTSTNEDGLFVLKLNDRNEAKIRVSCIGFKSIELALSKNDSSPFEIKLYPTLIKLQNDIVVTASRNELISFKSPDAVSVFSKEDIKNNAPRSTAEALMGTTGVWMQKTNHGGGSPFIRGLTGNQTLILIDGIRLNNSAFRYGPNQYFNTIDLFSVDHIEVVRGKGSVLYGSDALGGVINVISKSSDFIPNGKQLNGTINGKLMSQGMEQSTSAQLAFQTNKFSITGTTSFKNFGDLYAGGDLGKESPSGYDESGVSIKAKYKISDNWLLTSAFQKQKQNDVPRFDQVAQRGYKKYSFDPQIHWLAYAKAEHFSENPLFRRLKITVSRQLSDETRITQKNDSPTIKNEHDVVKTYNFTAELYSTISSNWSTVSGIEFYHDKINSSKIELNTETNSEQEKRGLYPNGSKSSNLAIFTNHSYDLGKINFNLGGRFNTFALNIFDKQFGDVELKPSSLVGNFSFQYSLNNTSKLILSTNSAFRAPNINDVSSFGLFDYGIEIPSSNLKPEKSLTIEAGLKKRTDKFSISLFAFNSWLNDQIARVEAELNGETYIEGERIYKKMNTAESAIRGLEFESGFQLSPALSLINNMTWLYGEDLTKNVPMRRIPPLNGKLALQYNKSNLFGEMEFLFASKQDRLSGGDIDDHRIPNGGTPGWKRLNMKFGYQWKKLSLNSGVQNIFNEAYRYHGSGIDGYGRSVWVSILYHFNLNL